MHTRHVLVGAVALGVVAMSVPACVGTVDSSAPDEEAPTKEEQAFDASIFHFGTVVPDDGHDPSGGSQRAVATLGFWDGRQGIIGQRWTCLVSVWLPLRLNYVTITPDRAAEMTAIAADAAGDKVMHSQPKWPVSVMFCKQFAAKMMEIFKKVPGGPTGAKVTAQ